MTTKPRVKNYLNRSILGIHIADVSISEVASLVSGWLVTKTVQNPHIVVTVGPEFILTAQKDREFRDIINSADISISESFGLQLSCGFRNHVPGIDLMLKLCDVSRESNWSVGLFGGLTGVAGKTAEKLKEKYPGIKIAYSVDGSQADVYLNNQETRPLPPVDLLFVNLGHPKQEKFLWNCKLKIVNCKFRVGMGVGGSFDLISGTLPRAPRLFQALGLEWFWRMWTKPGHIRRSFRATFGFWLALLTDLTNKSNKSNL